jgi:hypothetical protein
MDDSVNPVATHHLPSFITAPGQTDVLMIVTIILLAVGVLMFGVLFFWLHALPERVAHKSQKVQFEIVAVLALISLFTHMHIFWIVGLVLAFIDIPDFGAMMGRIARSLETMAGIKPETGIEGPREAIAGAKRTDETEAASGIQERAGNGDGKRVSAVRAEGVPAPEPARGVRHG